MQDVKSLRSNLGMPSGSESIASMPVQKLSESHHERLRQLIDAAAVKIRESTNLKSRR